MLLYVRILEAGVASTVRSCLPGMLVDTYERDLMASDELLLPVLKAFVLRLQNTDFTRSLLETLDVCGI
jgi:hypothetical protein